MANLFCSAENNIGGRGCEGEEGMEECGEGKHLTSGKDERENV